MYPGLTFVLRAEDVRPRSIYSTEEDPKTILWLGSESITSQTHYDTVRELPHYSEKITHAIVNAVPQFLRSSIWKEKVPVVSALRCCWALCFPITASITSTKPGSLYAHSVSYHSC